MTFAAIGGFAARDFPVHLAAKVRTPPAGDQPLPGGWSPATGELEAL